MKSLKPIYKDSVKAKQPKKINYQEYLKSKPIYLTDGTDLLLEFMYLKYDGSSVLSDDFIRFTSYNNISKCSPLLITEIPVSNTKDKICLSPLQKVKEPKFGNEYDHYTIGDLPYGLSIEYISKDPISQLEFEILYDF